MTPRSDRPVESLREAHHDGSALHLEPGPYALGDRVGLRVRIPADRPADRVLVRITPDAEPRYVDARIDRSDELQTWWVAELPVDSPVTNYRFLIERDTDRGLAATWLDAAGEHTHDVTDAADFRISIHRPPPAWLADTVGYQIFPDRFARAEHPRSSRPPPPAWARPAEWDDPVDRHGRTAVRQLYGGDLTGVEERLDHLVALGVNLVYLTPFFPAHSSHRYDATTFDVVDSILGGDAALASLSAAAHARGIRVIGDLTLNHTGRHHEWFERAQRDASSPEAGFYMFGEHPDEYVAWYDLPHLPKLDHRSPELARRLFDGREAVAARWMQPPYSLDGWRIDCANTTARHGEIDVNAAVAHRMRSAVHAHHPDPWLVAEHCYDSGSDLVGDGWHGTMAYQWFTRPLLQWLGTADPIRSMSPRPLPRLDGATMSEAMRALASNTSWAARGASMTMLDSHDTPRFRSMVSGDRSAHLTAMTALLTMPGVPTLFAGSEVGVTGDGMDAARRPFPWDTGRWDTEMLAGTTELIALRHTTDALRHGALRWLDADADHVGYCRESDDDCVVVHLARDPRDPPTPPHGSEVLARLGGAVVWRR